MTESIEELRAAIAQVRQGQERWRCPRFLKEKILTYTRECRELGIPVSRVARELNISFTALRRWLKASEPTAAPVYEVRVLDESSPSPAAVLQLVTPQGYRLEGLSPEAAVEILRRLSC